MKRAAVLFGMLALAAALPAAADVVEVGAAKDNTLFEEEPEASNGAGEFFFTGATALDTHRRGLIAFDVAAAIPEGATIDSATLTLVMSRTIAGSEPVSLHRVLSDWGEGASDAPGEEGAGTAAEPDDATWNHTFFPDEFWGTPGGDFEPAASASQDVAGNGSYSWTSATMAADVQSWLDDPAGNFGWMLVGNESVPVTAKRFNTKENGDDLTRPVLTVEFTLPGDGGGVPATSTVGLVVAAGLLLLLGSAALRHGWC